MPESNGHAPVDEDATMIASLRERVTGLQARRDELQTQMDEITPHLKRYEKAILALEGQPINQHRQRPDDEPAPGSEVRQPKSGGGNNSKISEERLAIVEASVRQIAATQDDVTQVLVRAATGLNSSVTAIAFEALRQRNVIRLVRRQGNLKVFRLTREALNAQPVTE